MPWFQPLPRETWQQSPDLFVRIHNTEIIQILQMTWKQTKCQTCRGLKSSHQVIN